MEKKTYDIIVVGSGVAGLSLAIETAKLRPDLKIVVLSKSKLQESNSNYAQGGIASVFNFESDSFEAHINDTLKSGGGLSNPEVVRHVIMNGPERILELEDYGVSFDRNNEQHLDLALEGGHSSPRVVHKDDHTGKTIIDCLLATVNNLSNIECLENRSCIELIKNDSDYIKGALIFNNEADTITCLYAKVVVLATGGCGQVYRYTTNPAIATGDGVFLAYKAGARLNNMHHQQFHPTALVERNKMQLFLISEAVRGAGAHIVNKKGQRFVFDYDKRGELATRDIVSKAIFSELKKSWSEHVYLDLRHMDERLVSKKFPTILDHLKSIGIDCTKNLIEITPAAHYQCGGIRVDAYGRTNVKGLFAIGECAETGLHGANRLASNSLLEALVYAHDVANYLSEEIDAIPVEFVSVFQPMINKNPDNISKDFTEMVKDIMSNYVTIFSEKEELLKARIFIEEVKTMFDLHCNEIGISANMLTARSVLTMAEIIIESQLVEWRLKKITLKRDKKVLI